MKNNNNIQAIDKRYTELSEKNCCLSCGKALEYASIKKGDICLDLGSGRGTDVLRMAEAAGDEGFAYGIDISSGMLEKAEKTAWNLGIKNVKYISSEIEIIPLPDKSVDLITSNCVINHASDKKKVWLEIYRILKKNGCFIVSDIYSTQTVPGEYAENPEAVAECWAGAVTRDIYLKTLKDTGFTGIEIIEESAPYRKGEITAVSFTVKGFKLKG